MQKAHSGNEPHSQRTVSLAPNVALLNHDYQQEVMIEAGIKHLHGLDISTVLVLLTSRTIFLMHLANSIGVDLTFPVLILSIEALRVVIQSYFIDQDLGVGIPSSKGP